MKNNPIGYSDPTGHKEISDGDGNGTSCPTQDLVCQIRKSGGNTNKDNDDWEIKACKNIKRGSRCGNAIDFFTNATILVDTAAAVVSLGEAMISDLAIAGTTALAIAQPELSPLIGDALLLDFLIAGVGGTFENALGGVSLATTVAVDVLAGNTYLSSKGVFVGKDTVVSARNSGLGLIPESNVDLVVSASQLKYDMDRLNGVKPGGSINLSNSAALFDQVFWNDSPLQDVVSGLVSWKQSMNIP